MAAPDEREARERRLRALIRDAEWAGDSGPSSGASPCCAWCRVPGADQHGPALPHEPTCPAAIEMGWARRGEQ